MRQLLLDDLWPTVAKLSKQASRVRAAIAYVSSADNLHLRAGDILIADASEGAIKTAQTSAKTLHAYHKDGVAIFNCPGLHAKLLLIGDKLIVGSANASGSSASRLTEAAILTDEATLVSQAQSFLFQLAKTSTALDGKSLGTLEEIKVVRHAFHVGGVRRRKIVARGQTTWIAMTYDLSDSALDKERRRIAAAERKIAMITPEAQPFVVKFWGNLSIRKRAENGDRSALDVVKNGVRHLISSNRLRRCFTNSRASTQRCSTTIPNCRDQ